jgi:anti-anti-sigma factor
VRVAGRPRVVPRARRMATERSGRVEQFEVDVVQDDERALLRVRGELDLATKDDLLAVLQPLWADGPPLVELDFSGVGFIDSSALSALVHLHRKGEEGQRRLVITHPSRPASRVLEVSGVDALIEVVRDDEGAGG